MSSLSIIIKYYWLSFHCIIAGMSSLSSNFGMPVSMYSGQVQSNIKNNIKWKCYNTKLPCLKNREKWKRSSRYILSRLQSRKLRWACPLCQVCTNIFGSAFIFVFVLLYVDIFRVFAIVLSTRHVPDVRNVSCGAGGHLGSHQLLPGLHHQIVIFSDFHQLVLAFLLPTNHISKHPNNNAANFRSRPLPSPPWCTTQPSEPWPSPSWAWPETSC